MEPINPLVQADPFSSIAGSDHKEGSSLAISGQVRANPIIWKLTAIGVALEILYAVFLVAPYEFSGLADQPLKSLGDLIRGSSAHTGQLAIALIAGLLLFYAGIRIARRDTEGRATGMVIVFGILSSLTLFVLHGAGSTDIFSYAMLGRILGHYHANPMFVAPKTFASDQLLPYVTWKSRPGLGYGPLWYFLSAIPSALGIDGIAAQLSAMKCLILAFHIANCFVIRAILLIARPWTTTLGVLLYAWNPLLVFEGPGDGHNDIIMIFFVLLALLLLVRGRKFWVMPVLALSVLIKPLTLALSAVFWFHLLRTYPTIPERLKFAMSSVAVTLTVVIVLYIPFWNGRNTLEVQHNFQDLAAHSPARLMQLGAQRLADRLPNQALVIGAALRSIQLSALVLSGCLILFLAWRRSGPHVSNLLAASYLSMFAFMLVLWWYHPWYGISLVTLAAVISTGDIAAHGLVFTASTLAGLGLILAESGDIYVVPVLWLLPVVYFLKLLWDRRYWNTTSTQ